jgi:hypothetical protein
MPTSGVVNISILVRGLILLFFDLDGGDLEDIGWSGIFGELDVDLPSWFFF